MTLELLDTPVDLIQVGTDRARDLAPRGRRHRARQIVGGAGDVAADACASELQSPGAKITCTHEIVAGHRRFFRRMTREPKNG